MSAEPNIVVYRGDPSWTIDQVLRFSDEIRQRHPKQRTRLIAEGITVERPPLEVEGGDS